MSFKKLILCTAVLAGLSGVPAVSMAAAVTSLPDFTQLAEQQGRSVVNIRTVGTVREVVRELPQGMESDPFAEFFRRFAPPQLREHKTGGIGSGFIVSQDGYILTNAHVIAKADEIIVTLGDKREFKAKLVGSDARTDVAVLKIDAANLPAVRTGKVGDLKVGEWVLAIGSPFGFESTVTSGIVSAKGRQLPDEAYVPFIQTDAAINPGNSGGPLFNLSGEVVGINSQIYSRSGGFMGISFAIPIDVALDVAAQLKKDGKVSRSRIGVGIQELSRNLAQSFGLNEPRGALITTVEKDGPGGKAGLQAGDVVLAVNGTAVQQASDLPRLIGGIRPDSRVALDVWRDRKAIKLTVVTALLPEEDPQTAERAYQGNAQPDGEQMNRSGLLVRVLPPQLAKRLGVPYGLQVMKAEGPADEAGIQEGDVIVGVAGRELSNARQLQEALAATPTGQALAMRILRQGQPLFVALTPEKAKK